MNQFCKTCPDFGAEVCAQPTPVEKLELMARTFGSIGIQGVVRSTGMMRGFIPPDDVFGLIEISRQRREEKEIPVKACVILHTHNAEENTD